MCKFIINGKFMGERMQGLVRYARELVCALDKISTGEDIIMLVPEQVEEELPLKNIAIVKYGKYKGILWEQIDLASYIRKHKNSICLNLCNVAPIFAPAGITVILDIMYKVNPSHYKSLRNRLSRFWHVFQYNLITRREITIITISDFCKQEICRTYPRCKEKIVVVPCAWQHVLQFGENLNWHKDYPFLKEKEFYFSLSTLAKNKNGKWIMEVAKRNPNATFAVGGKFYETEKYDIPSNVHMLGFISDEDSCSLMKNCKAFIHPALYEGFGLTPLEAMALGANVISSNKASLPEVLGDSAYYIDPYQYDINLDELLTEPISEPFKALKKYSWEKSAKQLLKCIKLGLLKKEE